MHEQLHVDWYIFCEATELIHIPTWHCAFAKKKAGFPNGVSVPIFWGGCCCYCSKKLINIWNMTQLQSIHQQSATNTDCPQNTAPQLSKTAAGPVLNLNQHKLIFHTCSTQSWAPTREKVNNSWHRQSTISNQQTTPTTNKKQLLTTATVQPIIKSNTRIPIAFLQQLHPTHQNTNSLENTERPNRKQSPFFHTPLKLTTIHR